MIIDKRLWYNVGLGDKSNASSLISFVGRSLCTIEGIARWAEICNDWLITSL